MIWAALAGLLNQNKQNGQQQEALKQQEVADNKRAHTQQSLQMQNLDFSNYGKSQPQGVQGSVNPVLDDIMKKYGAGRYSR